MTVDYLSYALCMEFHKNSSVSDRTLSLRVLYKQRSNDYSLPEQLIVVPTIDVRNSFDVRALAEIIVSHTGKQLLYNY